MEIALGGATRRMGGCGLRGRGEVSHRYPPPADTLTTGHVMKAGWQDWRVRSRDQFTQGARQGAKGLSKGFIFLGSSSSLTSFISYFISYFTWNFLPLVLLGLIQSEIPGMKPSCKFI